MLGWDAASISFFTAAAGVRMSCAFGLPASESAEFSCDCWSVASGLPVAIASRARRPAGFLDEDRFQRQRGEGCIVLTPECELRAQFVCRGRVTAGSGEEFVDQFRKMTACIAFEANGIHQAVERKLAGRLDRRGLFARVVLHRFNDVS